jgi:hypothetical protein
MTKLARRSQVIFWFFKICCFQWVNLCRRYIEERKVVVDAAAAGAAMTRDSEERAWFVAEVRRLREAAEDATHAESVAKLRAGEMEAAAGGCTHSRVSGCLRLHGPHTGCHQLNRVLTATIT